MAKDLYQMVLTQYNNYYLIARAMTRVRTIDSSPTIDKVQLQKTYDNEINFIRGIADSARIQLMNFSKNQLDKDVFYQHPAYPEKKDFSEAVKMGLPPEKENFAEKIELAKKILFNKKYLIEKNEENNSNQSNITSYIILNENYGGIPGSNIGIAHYYNTEYNEPGIHDDQEFFYVLEGTGKAKIDKCEIDILKDTMFVVPPGTKHSILSNSSKLPVTVLWMHNPIQNA